VVVDVAVAAVAAVVAEVAAVALASRVVRKRVCLWFSVKLRWCGPARERTGAVAPGAV
jgi:hypothetical protein